MEVPGRNFARARLTISLAPLVAPKGVILVLLRKRYVMLRKVKLRIFENTLTSLRPRKHRTIEIFT